MDAPVDTSLTWLLQLVLSSAFGVLAALLTTLYKFRKERQAAREKEKEHIRLKFLNPLLVSSEDFLDRLMDIKRRRKNPANAKKMQCWFQTIKHHQSLDHRQLAMWANDEGYFAMSTLYITALYFHHAGRIRRDFPFIELSYGGEAALLSRLSDVRGAIGGKFGIWEALQDSLGAYVEAPEGRVKNYRQMCEMIISDSEALWFNRLMDFYRDIHLKLDDHLDNIERALKELIRFLNTSLYIEVIGYRLTEAGLARLRQHAVPQALVDRLERLEGKALLCEVDFVAELVACIGQDWADDYKPSILACADKQPLRGA